jgi:nitroreductase
MTNLAIVQRAQALDRAGVADCLRAASAAPSIHNTQPWHLLVRRAGIEVHEDPDRQLAVIDPTGRSATISVGAAVFNLRIAVLAHGRVPLVLADPPSVELGRPVEPNATVRALVEAIPRRRTSRNPFAPTVVPAAVVDELCAAAAAEGAVLTRLDPVRRDAVLALTRTADERHRADERYQHELATWTSRSPRRRDGVPLDAYGPLDANGTFPVRDFGLARPDRYRRSVPFERHPQLVLLCTRGDDRRQWLHAGQAMQRVLLTATVRGVSTQPMTQALEFDDLRASLADPASGLVAQLVLRIGYGLPTAPSPRRPLSDLLIVA